MDLAELSALHSAARNQDAVLAAALDGTAPVLNVNHSFRAVLRAVSRATLHVAKMRMFPATFGGAGLEKELAPVEVKVRQYKAARKGGVGRSVRATSERCIKVYQPIVVLT